MPKPEDTDEAAELTRGAAAELAGVDIRTIDRWANEGRLTRHKVGGMQWVRFKRSEVLDLRRPEPVDPFAG
jgi:excisionase family DNA binding protein